jgi:peptide deformylase
MDDMVDTMRDAPGVGLAAPQVGVGLRVIVVEAPDDDEAGDDGPSVLHVLADPEYLWVDPEVEEGQEGCLSIPGLLGDVPRHRAVRIQALDRGGRRRIIEASGFEARVIQHEIDHLDGILFPDRVTSLDKLYTVREDEDGRCVRVPYAAAVL